MQSRRTGSSGFSGPAIAAIALTIVGVVALARRSIRHERHQRRLAIDAARAAERDARASESRHRALLDSALDAIIAMDRHGRIVEFNRAAEATFGYARELVLGRMLADAIIPPKLREAHRRGLERVRDSGQTRIVGQRLELTALRADGTEFPAEVSIVSVSPSSDGFFGFIRDISDRHAAEEARAQAGSLQAHAEELTDLTIRLEASYRELESFSYSVSHDLRTPLRAIAGFAGMLGEDYADRLDDVGRNHLRRIGTCTAQMSQMIDDLLKLSQVGRTELREEDVDLTSIVADVADDLRRAHPDREVELRVEPALHVRGDRALLRIVFDNLLGNAWKFAAQRPAALVEVGAKPSNGSQICFVRDNGIGFDMKDASRLFVPFQRLASAADVPGIGVGLATVDRIVRRHGGRIWAESEPGKGATFFIALRSDRG